MSPRASDVPEIVQFGPKERQPNDGDTLDQVGQAIVGLLQHAANGRAQRESHGAWRGAPRSMRRYLPECS